MVSISETVATVERVVVARQVLEQWPVALMAAGHQVVAPVIVDGTVEYRALTQQKAAPTGLGKGIARMSPKGAWFPRTETVLRVHRKDGQQWTINDPKSEFPSVVIFGARPCDAAAPEILAPLFGWDFHDAFFEERMKKIAFVVMACKSAVDAACFCTSVGIDPAGSSGADTLVGTGTGDVVLTELDDGTYLAEARSEVGKQLLAAIPDAQRKAVAETPAGLESLRDRSRQSIAKKFDADMVQTALAKRFTDPMWQQAAQSCLACGTCAYVCPTCHCFDLQDEMTGKNGIRQKNWDACAFPLFTVHTSGHNPRPDQPSRWRQRLSHKFRYYPEKFGHILCTGCGRCIRLCPAGMDLLADLQELSKPTVLPVPSPAESAAEPPPVRALAALDGLGLVAGILAKTADASSNIYRPYLMKVAMVRDETPDVRTLRLEFTEAKDAESFDFRVGQFGLYNAMGEGESTFCIASSSTRKGYIECTFREAGRVTRALRRLGVGDSVGFRGPYGNSFPVESWKGKDLLFVAGGIALPPMRSVIQYCLDNRQEYGDIIIIYGASTWSDHVYKDELAEWEGREDVNLWLCIDWKSGPGRLIEEAAMDGWHPLNMKNPAASEIDPPLRKHPSHRRYTGFVPQLVEAVNPSPNNRIAVLCGPPIMIKFTLASLKKIGYESEKVFTTLENRMKCGLGKCGRCNVGPIYVCKEGPVFTAREVEMLPPEL